MADELPAAPIPTDNALSGGVWVSGAGFDQTSGTPVDYAEYRQWMTIEYSRNPRTAFDASAGNTLYRSLAQLSSVDIKQVMGTRLHYNVTVHNSCTFLSGTYDLSASYQAQKFVVMAQKFDKVGFSYGAVSGAANAFVFGPQGSILTTQPYVRRKIKESADVEYSFTQVGTTDGYATSGLPSPVWGVGNEIGRPYEFYLDEYHDVGKTASDFPRSIFKTYLADNFAMGGGEYATTSEPGYANNTAGLQKLISFIEAACSCLNAAQFYWRFCVPNPANSDGVSTIVEADRLEINPYYSTAYHDYS